MTVLASEGSAFQLQNKYSFNSSDWLPKTVPEGHAFICKPCRGEIRVQITFGDRFDEQGAKTFQKVLSQMASSPSNAKKYAKDIVHKNIGRILSST